MINTHPFFDVTDFQGCVAELLHHATQELVRSVAEEGLEGERVRVLYQHTTASTATPEKVGGERTLATVMLKQRYSFVELLNC